MLLAALAARAPAAAAAAAAAAALPRAASAASNAAAAAAASPPFAARWLSSSGSSSSADSGSSSSGGSGGGGGGGGAPPLSKTFVAGKLAQEELWLAGIPGRIKIWAIRRPELKARRPGPGPGAAGAVRAGVAMRLAGLGPRAALTRRLACPLLSPGPGKRDRGGGGRAGVW
jgi:hypothetical protein